MKNDSTRVGSFAANATHPDGNGDAHPSCFHCGQPCPNHTFASAEKVFCCNGCLVVHDLLTETGLGHYYDLRRNPGSCIRPAAPEEQWAYLDEPTLAQRQEAGIVERWNHAVSPDGEGTEERLPETCWRRPVA